MSKYKNKKKEELNAVALKYNEKEDSAPIIIASGYGETAKNIIKTAEENGVPIFHDDSVSSMLCMLELGENIPFELYEIVAEIYKSIMEISNGIIKKKNK